MTSYNHIFDVKPNNANQHIRGFLDIKSKEIVIYDDKNGKELFRIGNNNPSVIGYEPQEQYEEAVISLEITNSCNELKTATLFASNREPLIQPLGITVIVKEIQSTIFDSHNYLRRDILTNPIKLRGMRYYVSNSSQFNNVIQFGHIQPYGKMKFYDFQPKSHLSLNQPKSNNFIEVPKFSGTVDANTQISVPVNPKTTCTLQFTALFKRTSGSTSRKSMYLGSKFMDTYNSISGNTENGNKKKSIFTKVLLTTALLSFGAFVIYKMNKIESRLPVV